MYVIKKKNIKRKNIKKEKISKKIKKKIKRKKLKTGKRSRLGWPLRLHILLTEIARLLL